MIVKIKGTGKSADMPTTYETDLDKDQADNLVRKGYAVIVEGKPEGTQPEQPKKEIKPITLASVKKETEEAAEVVDDNNTDAIAAKEKEFKEAPDKETKKKLKKELDDLKKKK